MAGMLTPLRKTIAHLLITLLILVIPGPTMAKQDLLVELFYSSAWHDVTSRVYTRDLITINHGAGNEQTGVIPSDATLTFGNRDGEMNPDNRRSTLYGLIGHNTPIRISVDGDVRFSGQIVSWKPRRAMGALDTTRGDAWVEVQAQGTIRRLGQGTSPVESALQRSTLGGILPQEHWSLEDGSDSTLYASTVGGNPGYGVVLQSGTDLPTPSGHTAISGAAATVLLPPGAAVELPVRPYSDTGQWVLQTALTADGFGVDVGAAVALNNGVLVAASMSEWLDPNTFAVDVSIFDATGAEIYGNTDVVDGVGLDEPLSLVLANVDTGAGDDFVMRILDGQGAVRAELTTTNIGYSTAAHVTVFNDWIPSGDSAGANHATLWTDAAFDVDVDTVSGARAASGWQGELAGERFTRLCAEEGITGTIVGSESDTQAMGPQYPDTVLNLFAEIARTDAGIIHDTRDQLGLTFRTGRSLYNQ